MPDISQGAAVNFGVLVHACQNEKLYLTLAEDESNPNIYHHVVVVSAQNDDGSISLIPVAKLLASPKMSFLTDGDGNLQLMHQTSAPKSGIRGERSKEEGQSDG